MSSQRSLETRIQGAQELAENRSVEEARSLETRIRGAQEIAENYVAEEAAYTESEDDSEFKRQVDEEHDVEVLDWIHDGMHWRKLLERDVAEAERAFAGCNFGSDLSGELHQEIAENALGRHPWVPCACIAHAAIELMTERFTTHKPVMDQEMYVDSSALLSNELIAKFDLLKEVCEAHPEVEQSLREKYFQYTLRRMAELGVEYPERVPGVKEACFACCSVGSDGEHVQLG